MAIDRIADIFLGHRAIHFIGQILDLFELTSRPFDEALHSARGVRGGGQTDKRGVISAGRSQALGGFAQFAAADHVIGSQIGEAGIAGSVAIDIGIERDNLDALLINCRIASANCVFLASMAEMATAAMSV